MFGWAADPHISTIVVAWVGAVCTIAILSIVYKENFVFRLFEHMYIGVAAGYAIFIVWTETLKPYWWDRMVEQGHWYWVFVGVAGAMLYFIYLGKHSWISKIVFGFMMGFASGFAFKSFLRTYVPRIFASYKPIAGPGLHAAAAAQRVSAFGMSINNIIAGVVLLTVMAYFFFSFAHNNRALRGSALLGRWCLMFAFGAMFGATVMARMSLFIARVDFLLKDWLHIY
jgi:hypothetical protein